MSFIDNISDEVSQGYDGWATAGSNLFRDALGGYIELERIKTGMGATPAGQQRTRETTTPSTGYPQQFPDATRAPQVAGLAPSSLLVGGLMLVGVVLVMR